MPSNHSQRHPVVKSQAKTIATLDFLTGGRVTLGVGFGWNAEEMADHGIDPRRRRSTLREYIEAMRSLWEDQTASYEGEFVRFGPSWAWPKPVQSRLPVLLGAAGTERSLSWIVRTADGWISTPRDRDVKESVDLLRSMWSDAGRLDEPLVHVLEPKPDDAKLAAWEELGVSEVLLGLPDLAEDDVLRFIDRRAAMISKFGG